MKLTQSAWRVPGQRDYAETLTGSSTTTAVTENVQSAHITTQDSEATAQKLQVTVCVGAAGYLVCWWAAAAGSPSGDCGNVPAWRLYCRSGLSGQTANAGLLQADGRMHSEGSAAETAHECCSKGC